MKTLSDHLGPVQARVLNACSELLILLEHAAWSARQLSRRADQPHSSTDNYLERLYKGGSPDALVGRTAIRERMLTAAGWKVIERHAYHLTPLGIKVRAELLRPAVDKGIRDAKESWARWQRVLRDAAARIQAAYGRRVRGTARQKVGHEVKATATSTANHSRASGHLPKKAAEAPAAQINGTFQTARDLAMAATATFRERFRPQ